jgi:hypothetical protein
MIISLLPFASNSGAEQRALEATLSLLALMARMVKKLKRVEIA